MPFPPTSAENIVGAFRELDVLLATLSRTKKHSHRRKGYPKYAVRQTQPVVHPWEREGRQLERMAFPLCFSHSTREFDLRCHCVGIDLVRPRPLCLAACTKCHAVRIFWRPSHAGRLSSVQHSTVFHMCTTVNSYMPSYTMGRGEKGRHDSQTGEAREILEILNAFSFAFMLKG